MAVLQQNIHVAVILLAILLFIFTSSTALTLKTCGIDRIYNVGDSISDTGNYIHEVPNGEHSQFTKLPYGGTFFKYPTGRCSDGLLIIDYIAFSAGLPSLPPYEGTNMDFDKGVNFAVAGATALSWKSLLKKRITNLTTNSSLMVQMNWMMEHLYSTSLDDTQLAVKLRSALFMVGEIGGNDYNFAFRLGKTIDEATPLVNEVVGIITYAARKLIEIGGTRIIIPGNIPFGCLPHYRTLFKSNDSAEYDENRCLKRFNSFSKYINNVLLDSVVQLQRENPQVKILYGDYYNAYMYLLQICLKRGYNIDQACCGIGGEFNYDENRMCGDKEAMVCTDPSRYLNWDGLHLTQRAYQIMAGWLIRDIVPKLKCSESEDKVSNQAWSW